MSHLTPLLCVLAASLVVNLASADQPSLWVRLGGEDVIKPMVGAIYDLHASDPLTAAYFGPHKFNNNGNADYVKEQVFHFFSAGIGGPYSYSGKDMVTSHQGMVISETAFHAISGHVLSSMEQFGAGGPAEREEVLSILLSLKSQVLSYTNSQAETPEQEEVSFLYALLAQSVPAYIQSLPIPKTLGGFAQLSLDDWYSLLPLILFLTFPLILGQACRKVLQAHDLEHNSTGVAQRSSFFYSGSALSALPYVLSFTPGLLAVVATTWAGQWSWLVAVAGYILVPIADLILGEDSYNPTEEEEDRLKKQPFFVVLTVLYTPSYIFTIVYGAWVISTRPELALYELAGITVSVGIAGGFGIGCVHELIHRPSKLELNMGILATVFANYSHFWIEHLWGHHKRVATDEDPASSNIGDDLYTFLVRDITQSFLDALDLEARFVKKRKLSFIHNRIFQGYTASALIAALIYSNFGTNALWFYLGQGVVTALHIENANYIEHYGLRRRKIEGKFSADGDPIYERPGWFHAWDTADRLTNWMLFKIQRHPDHHTNAGRPYQILRTLPYSPTMPTGYAGMFVLSWFPPLFFAVMNPLVENAYRKREEMEANGLAASAFPKGSNNMSSYFKREGEGYFEKGSSPYQDPEYYGSDASSKTTAVWDVQYNKEFEKGSKASVLVESAKIKVIKLDQLKKKK